MRSPKAVCFATPKQKFRECLGRTVFISVVKRMSTRRFIFVVPLLLVYGLPRAVSGEPRWLTVPPTPSLPVADRSGYAPINGIKIWYAVFGSGEPVILLHGGLSNSNCWGKQVPVLAEHYQVVVMDSRGHGRSTATSSLIAMSCWLPTC